MTVIKVIAILITLIGATLNSPTDEESCVGCSMERRKPMRYGKRGSDLLDLGLTADEPLESGLAGHRLQRLYRAGGRRSDADRLMAKIYSIPYFGAESESSRRSKRLPRLPDY